MNLSDLNGDSENKNKSLYNVLVNVNDEIYLYPMHFSGAQYVRVYRA